ncbi:M48 family metallopeptidase [Bermanella sp. R86510]|uniref:M48 family metallopeptidase n=1 Tax=unclassified Bermanella TaxID=2627862 RepID=UPI0037CADD48
MSIDYKVRYSRRKTAAIHITEQGVELRLPYGVSERWGQMFVESKQDWITAKLADQHEQLQQRPVLALGESILWRGQEMQLRFQVKHQRPRLRVQDGVFCWQGPTSPTQDQWRSALRDLFLEQAKQELPALTQAYAQELNLQQKLNQVRFRHTKRKWGHCSSAGNIQYNWLIMGAPSWVIEYLVCHEVSHLRHLNHSAKFWQTVASIYPNYKQAQSWLKAEGIRLSWY